MKLLGRTFIFFVLSSLYAFSLQAQTQRDSIITDYSFWGNNYFINGREISRSEVIDIIKSNPISKDLVSSSRMKETWGYITLTAGVLVTSFSLIEIGLDLNNYGEISKSNYLMFFLAITCDFVGSMLIDGSNKSFRKAIKSYNKNLSVSIGHINNLGYEVNRIVFSYSF